MNENNTCIVVVKETNKYGIRCTELFMCEKNRLKCRLILDSSSFFASVVDNTLIMDKEKEVVMAVSLKDNKIVSTVSDGDYYNAIDAVYELNCLRVEISDYDTSKEMMSKISALSKKGRKSVFDNNDSQILAYTEDGIKTVGSANDIVKLATASKCDIFACILQCIHSIKVVVMCKKLNKTHINIMTDNNRCVSISVNSRVYDYIISSYNCNLAMLPTIM